MHNSCVFTDRPTDGPRDGHTLSFLLLYAHLTHLKMHDGPIDVWKIFFLGASQINFKPESKARPNFFLDFLPFFLSKLLFFNLSSSKIDYSDKFTIIG